MLVHRSRFYIYAVLLITLQLSWALKEKSPKRTKQIDSNEDNDPEKKVIGSYVEHEYMAYHKLNGTKPKDMEFGHPLRGDALLDAATVTAAAKVADVVKGKSAMSWYFFGNRPKNEKVIITHIAIKSLMDTMHPELYGPARAIITHGGIGHNEVVVLFLSDLGFGFKYKVVVRGKKL